MDEHRDYHTKRSKSERERQMPYITYKWNLKYDTNEQKQTDTENRLVVAKGGMGEGRIGSLGLADANYYI